MDLPFTRILIIVGSMAMVDHLEMVASIVMHRLRISMIIVTMDTRPILQSRHTLTILTMGTLQGVVIMTTTPPILTTGALLILMKKMIITRVIIQIGTMRATPMLLLQTNRRVHPTRLE